MPISFGPRGTGKTSVVKILLYMNCPNRQWGSLVTTAISVGSITNGSLEDVIGDRCSLQQWGSMKFAILRQVDLCSKSKPSTIRSTLSIEVHMLSRGLLMPCWNIARRNRRKMWSLSCEQRSCTRFQLLFCHGSQRFEFKSIKLPDIVQHLKIS